MKIKQLGCILALAMFASAANATVTLYDYITGNTANAASAVPPGAVASSFTTGSLCPSGCTLVNITLNMFMEEDASVDSITVGLYSDAGTAPDSLLATLVNPSTIDDTLADTIFSAPAATVLDSNTIYWVQLSADEDSAGAEWGRTGTSGGSGNYLLPNGANGSSSPFMYSVEADASVVPVPASIWLMVTALTGLAVRARKVTA